MERSRAETRADMTARLANRRAQFVRSQTINSGGPVPFDGERQFRYPPSFYRSTSAASSSTSLVSASSIGPIINLIRVRSAQSSNSIDSVPPSDPNKSEENGGAEEPKFFAATEFMSYYDGGAKLDVRLLRERNTGYIINFCSPASVIRENPLAVNNHNVVVENLICLYKDAPPEDTISRFSEINRIIAKARDANVKVLIYTSKAMRSSGYLAILQYLMWYYDIGKERVIDHWARIYGKYEQLPCNFCEALKKWENEMKTTEPSLKRCFFPPRRGPTEVS